ncbi:hypothetical protein JKP88DRAFT_276983 [Tribonema minus]|uniref:Uncharacterized protein n=1 Tax=Tribonema minus TaxID=303371 RepID=A0A835Z797_9STRA|nr:hypothetical protein JKP88DRAFT_276983 [Tribonema minus]
MAFKRQLVVVAVACVAGWLAHGVAAAAANAPPPQAWVPLRATGAGAFESDGYMNRDLINGKPVKCPPFVILPGFSNADMDYFNPFNQGYETSLVAGLARRGVTSYVLPLERKEWFNVVRGFREAAFWRGAAPPECAYGWYLEKVRATVALAREETGAPKVALCGHSAGGWLARAALGDGTWSTERDASGQAAAIVRSEDVVCGVVTLGAPHFPGAFLKDRGVQYVTVAGAAIRGAKDAPRADPARRAYNSYQLVCGEGETDGDGCVPVVSAHLEGALQITLDGVKHTVDTPNTWYGTDENIGR